MSGEVEVKRDVAGGAASRDVASATLEPAQLAGSRAWHDEPAGLCYTVLERPGGLQYKRSLTASNAAGDTMQANETGEGFAGICHEVLGASVTFDIAAESAVDVSLGQLWLAGLLLVGLLVPSGHLVGALALGRHLLSLPSAGRSPTSHAQCLHHKRSVRLRDAQAEERSVAEHPRPPPGTEAVAVGGHRGTRYLHHRIQPQRHDPRHSGGHGSGQGHDVDCRAPCAPHTQPRPLPDSLAKAGDCPGSWRGPAAGQ